MGDETSTFDMPHKVVAVGDLQGNIEGLEAILEHSGLVDEHGTWAGGDAHLVQLGDIFGRATEPRECCDRLMELERRAMNAGGRVHVLLGNHEAEVVHRYEFECNPQEYLNFATHATLAAWERYRRLAEESFWEMGEDRSLPIANLSAAWELLNPVGREEFREGVRPSGRYGTWLCARPAAVQVGPLLFSHAGLSWKWAREGLDELNRRVREEMSSDLYFADFPETGVLVAPDGPLWLRDLAWGGKGVRDDLHRVLQHFGASAQVIGHTPTQDGWINSRYARRVLCIDTGVGRQPGGRLSALLVEAGNLWALYPPRVRKLVGPVPPRVA